MREASIIRSEWEEVVNAWQPEAKTSYRPVARRVMRSLARLERRRRWEEEVRNGREGEGGAIGR